MKVSEEPNLEPESAAFYGDTVISVRPEPEDEPICDFCNSTLGRYDRETHRMVGRPGALLGTNAICEECTVRHLTNPEIQTVRDIRDAVLKLWAGQEGWN